MTIRVLVLNECGVWVAQCLEVDIATQAGNLDDLRSHLLLTLRAELRDKLPEDIGPAPAHFQKLWADSLKGG